MDGNTRRCRTKAERLVVTPEVLDSGVTLGSCAPFASGAKECGTQLQAQGPIDCAENGSGLVVGCGTRHAQILETLSSSWRKREPPARPMCFQGAN